MVSSGVQKVKVTCWLKLMSSESVWPKEYNVYIPLYCVLFEIQARSKPADHSIRVTSLLVLLLHVHVCNIIYIVYLRGTTTGSALDPIR